MGCREANEVRERSVYTQKEKKKHEREEREREKMPLSLVCLFNHFKNQFSSIQEINKRFSFEKKTKKKKLPKRYS